MITLLLFFFFPFKGRIQGIRCERSTTSTLSDRDMRCYRGGGRVGVRISWSVGGVMYQLCRNCKDVGCDG